MDNVFSGTMPNGIRYIFTHTNESDQSVGIFIRVHYGTAFDKKPGLAHLLEHLLFKGTKARPQSVEIMRQLNSIGAECNAYTDYTETAYYSKCAHVHLEKNLELLCDMITGTDFGAAKMEREFRYEKTVVSEELKGILDNPKRYISELVRKNLFVGKLALNAKDSLVALPSITLADVIATYRRYYVGSNIVVSLNGNLSGWGWRPLKTLLSKLMGRLPRGRANTKLFRANTAAAYFAARPTLRQICTSTPANQTAIQITYPVVIGRHRQQQQQQYDYYLQLFQLVFANLTSGRLFQSLREQQGLIYSVKAEIVKHDDVGYFAMKTTTTPANVARVLAILRKEISRVQRRGLNRAEFSLAKANFLATWAMAEEDVMTPAAFHGTELFNKMTTLYSDVPTLIDKMTLTHMNAFIARLLSKPAIVTLL
jgi:predicted Zn-dependent peptidase